MSSPYKNQHIWIIGASSGIGAALARELSQQGAILALSARREESLQAVQKDCSHAQAHMIAPLDVGDIQSVRRAFDDIQSRFPKIDRVIFMAAIYSPHDGTQKDIGFIHDMLRVNIGGAYNMLDVIVPYFKKLAGADQYQNNDDVTRAYAPQISICASVAGYRGLPTGQPYCSTKAALINLSESLRVELSSKNPREHIDVKVINPGFVQTPLTDKNNFAMPMMIPADEAARHIAKGLNRRAFEIHFPKRFTAIMKLLRMLPPFLYFWLAKKMNP